MKVNIVGIDCATDPKNVGFAFASFSGGRTVVDEAGLGTAMRPPADTIADWLRQRDEPALLVLDAVCVLTIATEGS